MQAAYDHSRAAFLSEFEWMRKSLEDYRTAQGGDNMPPDAARNYNSRKRRLRTIADFFDAAEEHIKEMAANIQQLQASNRRLRQAEHDLREATGNTCTLLENHVPYRTWLQMMNIVGSSQPQPLAVLLNVREGKRNASVQYAQVSQPYLFTANTPAT